MANCGETRLYNQNGEPWSGTAPTVHGIICRVPRINMFAEGIESVFRRNYESGDRPLYSHYLFEDRTEQNTVLSHLHSTLQLPTDDS